MKKFNKRDRKAELSTQVFFYIFMTIIFAGILIFGFNEVFFVKDQISEQQRIEIQTDLIEFFEYCEDPLNSGNVKNMEVDAKKFDGIYLVGSNIRDRTIFSGEMFDELRDIREGGDNVVLFKADYESIPDPYDPSEMITKIVGFQVYDTFEIDVDFSSVMFFGDGDPNSQIGDTQRDGTINLLMECKK